jgi:hypothetical protein
MRAYHTQLLRQALSINPSCASARDSLAKCLLSHAHSLINDGSISEATNIYAEARAFGGSRTASHASACLYMIGRMNGGGQWRSVLRLPDSIGSVRSDDSETELDGDSGLIQSGSVKNGFGTDRSSSYGMDAALGLLCSGELEEAKLEALRVLGSEGKGRCGDNTLAVVECWWRFGPWSDACQSEHDMYVVCMCMCVCMHVCVFVCVKGFES